MLEVASSIAYIFVFLKIALARHINYFYPDDKILIACYISVSIPSGNVSIK